MLITNFSAGELSEDLFGRIDLAQYYQGAARLENFDLIPSGGIEKRRGTARILAGLENGRIIPFVVSREEAYLLHLTHEKITVYRTGEWDEAPTVFTSEQIDPETLYTEEEIPLVQHAQNFRTMVMVHKNHPPLRVNFLPGEISITIYTIVFPIQFIHSPEVIPGFDPKDDETYEKGHLTQPEQYPGCVTFFNQRLVFASTIRNGQRLFFSRVDKFNDFSTYKAYITETRNYTVVRASISNGLMQIRLVDQEEGEKITQAPEKYRIDSMFFPEGTRLLTAPYEVDAGSGNKKILMDVDQPAEGVISSLPEGVEEELNKKVIAFTNANKNKKEYKKIAKFYTDGPGLGGVMPIDIYIGASQYILKEAYTTRSQSYDIAESAASLFDEGKGRTNLISDITTNAKIFAINHKTSTYTGFSEADCDNPIPSVVDAWKPKIMENMKYSHVGLPANPYYGFMPDIRTRILSAAKYDDAYIPMYTTEQTMDEYPTADDGFTFELASDRNDEIRWLVQNKNLIAGTESAEYVIPSNITAININAYLNSFYGSSRLQATSAGDAVLFFRDGNKGMVEYYIPQADNYFRTNDLLMFARQMLRESVVVDYDVVTSPYTVIIVTRADGQLANLLYDRAFGVFAWARYSGAGKVRSLAVVPGKSGYDEVYLLVEHDGKFFLELFQYDGRVYLDSYTQLTPNNFMDVWKEYVHSGHKLVFCHISKGENGEDLYEELDASQDPDWSKGGEFFIGYPYRSTIRTLPVIDKKNMSKQRITSITFRFLKSYLPELSSIAGGRNIKTDTITNLKTPYSGVHKTPFPGTWDEDVQVELSHSRPEPVKIISLDAEVQ